MFYFLHLPFLHIFASFTRCPIPVFLPHPYSYPAILPHLCTYPGILIPFLQLYHCTSLHTFLLHPFNHLAFQLPLQTTLFLAFITYLPHPLFHLVTFLHHLNPHLCASSLPPPPPIFTQTHMNFFPHVRQSHCNSQVPFR